MRGRMRWHGLFVVLAAALVIAIGFGYRIEAQGPAILDSRFQVRTVFDGLTTPISLAFLDERNFLVLEKNTGRVRRVSSDQPEMVVLDLAVNFASERGLLGIALHPSFPVNPGVYLFWTESSTGVDTNTASQTTLLGNRVDRFTWNGATLTFDQSIIALRARQSDAGQGELANHNGGVLRFGPDGKLYVFVGDVGRRGQTQNLADGPSGVGLPDDQYGGPEPDDAHLTGVILRLNDDGSAPSDNPFVAAGAAIGGQAGANIQKIFSYGHRNGFGMDFDPRTGTLWMQENGDDSFSELNRVLPGMNGGWVQIAGPSSRVRQFKEIETSFGAGSLQQLRWLPENIADSPSSARARLFMLAGAHYAEPAFSWKWEIAPGGIAFQNGRALGKKFDGDLFMGAATTQLQGGYLFRFDLNDSRTRVKAPERRTKDRVADNLGKHDITESEPLLFGRNFGVASDLISGPNGNLFVVSLSHGAVYEIYRP